MVVQGKGLDGKKVKASEEAISTFRQALTNLG